MVESMVVGSVGGKVVNRVKGRADADGWVEGRKGLG